MTHTVSAYKWMFTGDADSAIYDLAGDWPWGLELSLEKFSGSHEITKHSHDEEKLPTYKVGSLFFDLCEKALQEEFGCIPEVFYVKFIY